MDLVNSTRSLPKATYVRLKLDSSTTEPLRALDKSSFLRSLSLSSGEVLKAFEGVEEGRSPVGKDVTAVKDDDDIRRDYSREKLISILKQFEDSQIPLERPPPSLLASIPVSQLINFGNNVISVRQKALDAARSPALVNQDVRIGPSIGGLLNSVQTARAALSTLSSSGGISPIGMLNLERLDMTPAGIELGELIATIPLAPKEKTTVVQQEWSTISQEFTTIVTDSLENYSETGVAESTELAQATTSQNSHANQ